MGDFWAFLSSPENRDALAWLGGGLCVAASGLWVVIRHFWPAPSEAKPKAPVGAPGPLIGGNMTVGGDLRIGDARVPYLALGLGGLGVLLMLLALLFGGGDTITGGVSAGRDISGTVTITNSPSRREP